MFNKALVCFDASDESYKAFDYALEMADSCKNLSEIYVLSVVQPPQGLYLVETDRILDETTKKYETLLKELQEKAKAKNIKASTKIAIGHPAEMIVQTAKQLDCPLIIIGHKGRSKIEGMLLGSVSRRVASMATCSVLIARG